MDFLQRLKQFLRQNVLWLGLVAVAIPLLINLTQQYRALNTLQKTMPAARTVYMRRFLSEAANKVAGVYKDKAQEILNVPTTAFLYRYPEPEQLRKGLSSFPRTINPSDYLNYEQIRQHFRAHPFNGARLLFIGIVAGPTDPTFSFVDFYDPRKGEFIASRKVSESELGGAHAAAANWTAMTMTNTKPPSLRLTVDERDPQNRLIVKPIADEKSRVVGVVGLFLDQEVFQQEYLVPALNASLPGAFPEDHQGVVLTLNEKKKVIYANQPYDGAPYEVSSPLPFIFTDWYLGLRMKNMTEEQWSRQYFLSSLASAVFSALILLGGIVLTLRSASRAMRLSQMKADFVSNVSHELRTPLASIRVFGEFLKMGRVKDSAKIQEYGEYIETESRRLTQLINNILDFSKIESGQKTYHFEPADVEAVVAETLKTFAVRLEQSGFAIALESPAQPLPCAVIDADAVAQAFINLLDNAVKYSGEARHINVKLAQQDGFVTIAVTDFGIGIATSERSKVFEKFYRVSTGLVHDVKGSGLGLSIVKHVIEAHQGKVTVESELGKGSTFTIWLPASEQASSRLQSASGGLLGAPAELQSEI